MHLGVEPHERLQESVIKCCMYVYIINTPFRGNMHAR